MPGRLAERDVAGEAVGGLHRGERRLAPERVDDHVEPPRRRPPRGTRSARSSPPSAARSRRRPARRRAPGPGGCGPRRRRARRRAASRPAPRPGRRCPVAPSTSTVSPSRSFALQVSASQPASPAIPSATATPSSTPSGTGWVADEVEQRALGERAVRRRRVDEVGARAVLEPRDALPARHARQRRLGRQREHAGGLADVDRVQTRGQHVGGHGAAVRPADRRTRPARAWRRTRGGSLLAWNPR